MDGEKDLRVVLGSMDPELSSEDFVFCPTSLSLEEAILLDPWALIREGEGLTAVVEKGNALRNGLPFQGTFKRITLNVHSSLAAVGLTAAVSARLARAGISANIVAAFYHDHVFIHSEKAQEALAARCERWRRKVSREPDCPVFRIAKPR